MLRSGTTIGALIREAEHAQSKPDFQIKMNIALKEANETDYCYKGEYLNQQEYNSLELDIKELIKLLAKNCKNHQGKFGKII